jgi:hypothetical protein
MRDVEVPIVDSLTDDLKPPGPIKVGNTVLYVAVIYGNKKQLKVYCNSLPEGQWQILRSTEDIGGMTPVDVAKHIVENIKTENWAEIKQRYYRGENEEFWQDFDFDRWVEYYEWFLNGQCDEQLRERRDSI